MLGQWSIGGDQCGQVKSISFLFWLLCEKGAQLLQSCLTLGTTWTQSPRLLCPRDFPGKDTGEG